MSKLNQLKKLILIIVLLLPSIGISHARSESLIDQVKMNRLIEFSPRANQEILEAIEDAIHHIMQSGINTELRILHFIAQTATETGGFRRLDENLNYSAGRLREVFGARVSISEAQRLANKPVEIANHVYANRLGNGGPDTNDGWNYRGSGFLQLTGRSNFRIRGAELSMPLEKTPEVVRQPKAGLRAAIAYWSARNINSAADRDDISQVRKLINGGTNGLAAARLWYIQARKKLSVSQGGPADLTAILADEAKAVTEALEELGYTAPKGMPGSQNNLQDPLKAFQKDHSLNETGFLDVDTLYTLTDPDGRFLN